jgi:hypothetical protein
MCEVNHAKYTPQNPLPGKGEIFLLFFVSPVTVKSVSLDLHLLQMSTENILEAY